ncbi:MAG TPA: glycine zipper 2TM domain-containing protein [Sphingomonas sp.]|nr:glycine zipper 2TM domain-containing protein [Sphingomonas sp.]
MRKLIIALSAAALTAPVAVVPTDTAAAAQYRTWRGKDGRIYCRRPNGTTGLIIGGAAGALVGNAIAGGTTGTILGAAGGALLGREVQRSKARQRCAPLRR